MKSPINLRLTPAGHKQLVDELADLVEQRPGVLKRMVDAREQGDLSENAGYHAAKERLGYIDSRVRRLKIMIRLADVVSGEGGSAVSFGKTVTVEGENGKLEFTVVSDLEADPAKGKMSDKSPIGSAVLGKNVGDSAEISTPDGKSIFKIVEIK